MKIVKKILMFSICMVLATGIVAAFAGCGHAHVWSDEWESDSAVHSRECTGCGEIEQAEHTYEDGVCTVCGYECEHDYTDGVCTICGCECVHEYAAEWSCDTQTHWHECAICASKIDERAHEYLLGECTECGYVCAHDGLRWKITELNHYGTCAQCGTTLSGRHEYSGGACIVCLKPEPEVIEVDCLIEDVNRIVVLWFFSSFRYDTTDPGVISRVTDVFENVQFTETSRTLHDVYGDKFQATGQYMTYIVEFHGYVYSEDGEAADFEYAIDINVFTDGTGFIELKKDDGWHYYITDIGAIDYAVIDEVHDELEDQFWEDR